MLISRTYAVRFSIVLMLYVYGIYNRKEVWYHL